MASQKLIKHLEWVIKYDQKYMIFYKILKCSDDNEAIKLLQDLKPSEESYKRELKNFKSDFPAFYDEVRYLSDIFVAYTKVEHAKIRNKTIDIEKYQIYASIIKNVIESRYSVEEYCSKYGEYKVKDIYKMAEQIQSLYPSLYVNFATICMEPREEFYNHMKIVAEIMQTNRSFNTFDYYYETKLHPSDFRRIIKKIIPKEQFVEIDKIIKKYIQK